jgi:hypothetical protein
MRLVLTGIVLAGLTVAAACSSERTITEPPPPLVASDRPVPHSWWSLWTLGGPEGRVCFDVLAKRQLPCAREEARPSPLAERGRILAELPLRGGRKAAFVLYKSGGKSTCFDVQVIEARGVPRSPWLSCQGDKKCGPICLSVIQYDSARRRVVAGTVSTRGDAIRITAKGGIARTYPLEGPTVASLRGQRIFMADLDSTLLPNIELLQDDDVIARLRMRGS